MAAVKTQPLVIVSQYCPHYRVNVYLDEHHWHRILRGADEHIEMMVLCSELETLCQNEHDQPSLCESDGSSSACRVAAAAENVTGYFQRQFAGRYRSFRDYTEKTRLNNLFPRACAYISWNGTLLPIQKAPIDSYFRHMAKLNQLRALSLQLKNDIHSLSNHKYIPYQIALLFQNLSSFTDNEELNDAYKLIEKNFEDLKASLSHENKLSQEHSEWLLEATNSVASVVTSFPRDITQPLRTVAQFLRQNVK